MQPSSEAAALSVAADLYRASQPLGAAIVCAELARGGASSPILWSLLAAALMGSRGVFVREPFEEWTAKVLRRAEPLVVGTPDEGVVRGWWPQLSKFAGAAPLADAELPAMIDFLIVHERVLIDAVTALGDDDRMGATMALGDRRDPIYLPLLRAAIEGRLGGAAARSAAKRIGPFLDRPDLRASLLTAREGPIREALGPYLESLLERMPAGWDAPRSDLCPPYEGTGRWAIELGPIVGAREACAAVLHEHLGASARDIESWMRSVPCTVKRGATRFDALQLQQALESAGAAVTLREAEDTSTTPRRPASAQAGRPRRPWWRFW